MFPGGSGSQDSFSPRTLSTTPVSSCPSNLEIVSPQADIAETLSFLPGIPSPNPEWPAHSAFVVQDSALPAQRFGLSLSPQHSVSALNPPRQLDTVLNSEYPLANPIGHPSLEDTIHIKQEYTSQNPRQVIPESCVANDLSPGLTRASPSTVALASHHTRCR